MRSFVVVASLLLNSGGAIAAQTPQIRDSAGIQIVENGLRAKAPVIYRIGDHATLDIGGLQPKPDDELSVSRLHLATRLAEGRIAVVDDASVRYYTSTGRLLKSVGRAGSGPTDFRSTTGICRTRGDTVLVYDTGNARFAVLDPAGKVVTTVPYPRGGDEGILSQFCFGDGSVIERRRDDHVTATQTDGKVRTDFGALPVGRHVLTFAVMLLANGDKMYVADNRISEVRIFSEWGKLLRIVRTNDPAAPITSAQTASGEGVSGAVDVGGRGRASTTGGVTSRASKTWPAYGYVMVDPSGRLWMKDEAHAAVLGWTVFDASGKILGRWQPPAHPDAERWTIVGFGTADVMVTHLDGDGAVHLSFYPLLPVR